jgi:DNA-binding CsgD family transcriptional regulator
MPDIEAASSLIGDIYDAALEPKLWTGVLRKVRSLVGGSAASLFAKGTARSGLVVHQDEGALDPEHKRLYLEKYAAHDPLTPGQLAAGIGMPFGTSDLMPYSAFLETSFHKEWARPQGLVDFACVVLERSAAGVVMLGIFRHERDGLVDDEARRCLEIVVPHIRRATLIERTLQVRSDEAATFGAVLDGLSASLFLTDARGGIVHANASGQALLEERSVLCTSGGKLLACDGKGPDGLTEALEAVTAGDVESGHQRVAVPLRGRDGQPYVAHVLPLLSRRRRADPDLSASIALLVHKAELTRPPLSGAIAKHYNLTPAELRVMLAVVELGGVPDAAQALGIGEGTVKTHLHRLFGKTGATRQADLVKLVAGFSSALTGPSPARPPVERPAAAAMHDTVGRKA